MTLHCWRAKSLLEQRNLGLDEPRRLLLEEHLAECDDCRTEADALAAVTTLLGEGFELSSSRRSRALSRALDARQEDAAGKSSRSPRPVLLLAAASLFLVAAFFIARARSSESPRLLAKSPSVLFDVSRIGDRVQRGDIRVEGAKLDIDAPVAEGAVLSSESGGKVRLAHAEVALGAETRARWSANQATLLLEHGSVHVEVDPGPKRAFAVATPRFRVEVTGTIFDVSLDSVRVSAGHVRVLENGSVRTVLDPGQRWSLENVASETAALEPEPGSTSPKAAAVGALLAHARARLASGDAKTARRDVSLALASHPTPTQDAEARSLLAECALVAGDTAEAQRRYADVARQHAGTAAAETAMFAAARIERDPARRASLLRSYLAKYPNGRFSAEARSRLQNLGK